MLHLIFTFLLVTQSHAEGSLTQYFPFSYREARARFVQGCDKSLATHSCTAYVVPSRLHNDLTVDSALFSRAGNTKLLALISGVHGAEAYAGSAVQNLVLHEHLDSLLNAGIDILMIHAANPFGFLHNRRATENNVNLNRNFIRDPKLFSFHNSSYGELSHLLEPQGAVSSPGLSAFLRSVELVGDYITSGFDAQGMIVAIGQGQYHSPQGLEYGGSTPEPNVAIIEHILSTTFPRYTNVLTLDIHTGLGAQNTLHMITGQNLAPATRQKLEDIFSFAKEQSIVFTSGSDSGFYVTHGDLIDFIPTIISPRTHVMAITAEFGTLGNSILNKLSTANRLTLENQGYHFGYESESVKQQVQKDFCELFNPSSIEWKTQVLQKADAVIKSVTQKF